MKNACGMLKRAPDRLGIEAALDEMPIFPLSQVVLFPNAILPLHIFEPRYRALLKDCLASHGAMAMAMLDPSAKGEEPDRPPIRAVAGVGVVIEHQPLPDGRSYVLLHGRARVRLEELEFAPPYRRARATVIPDTVEAVPDADVAALRAAVAAFAAEVRKRHPDIRLQMPPASDGGVLADCYAHQLIADVAVRQALLEEPRPQSRVRIVTEQVSMQLGALRRESGGLQN